MPPQLAVCLTTHMDPAELASAEQAPAELPHAAARIVLGEGYLALRALCAAARVSRTFRRFACGATALGATLDLAPFGAALREADFAKFHERRIRFKGARRLRYASLHGCTHLSAKSLAAFVSKFGTNPLLPPTARRRRAANTNATTTTSSAPATLCRTRTNSDPPASSSVHNEYDESTGFSSSRSRANSAPTQAQSQGQSPSQHNYKNSLTMTIGNNSKSVSTSTSIMTTRFPSPPSDATDAYGAGLRVFVWDSGSARDWEVQRVLYRCCDVWCSVRRAASPRNTPLAIELFLWIRSDGVRKSITPDELAFAIQALRPHPDFGAVHRALLATCRSDAQPDNVVPQKIRQLEDAAIYIGTICPGNCCLQVMAKEPSARRKAQQLAASRASSARHEAESGNFGSGRCTS